MCSSIIQIVFVVGLLAGAGMTIVSLVTPVWREFNTLGRENYFGLFVSCIKTSPNDNYCHNNWQVLTSFYVQVPSSWVLRRFLSVPWCPLGSLGPFRILRARFWSKNFYSFPFFLSESPNLAKGSHGMLDLGLGRLRRRIHLVMRGMLHVLLQIVSHTTIADSGRLGVPARHHRHRHIRGQKR